MQCVKDTSSNGSQHPAQNRQPRGSLSYTGLSSTPWGKSSRFSGRKPARAELRYPLQLIPNAGGISLNFCQKTFSFFPLLIYLFLVLFPLCCCVGFSVSTIRRTMHSAPPSPPPPNPECWGLVGDIPNAELTLPE